MTKMGPNDTRRIVWTLGKFFSFLSPFFISKLMFYCIYRFLSMKYVTGRMMTMRTGSNNARCVIWAIGEFFKNFFVFFSILN